MSRFYGTVEGQARTTATRRGGAASGVVTHAAGWGGAVRVEVRADGERDVFEVSLVPWQGSGRRVLVASGELGGRGELAVYAGQGTSQATVHVQTGYTDPD